MSENSNTINMSTESPEMLIGERESSFSIGTPKTVINKDHSKMKNLDFESSGHTGFASSKDIEEINNKLLNYVKDENYVHTDNNYTNEDKEKLDNLENVTGKASDISYKDNTGQGVDNVQDAFDEAFSQIENLNNTTIDGKNIPYEDNYGYGTPDNMHDALDFAFEEIDGRMTYNDVVTNYVGYNAIQKMNATQQQRARNNIGIPNSCIMYSQVQNLSQNNKNMARHNIGVRGFNDLGEIDLADYDDDVWTFINTLTGEGTYKFIDNVDYFTWVVETWWLGEYYLGQKYFYEEEGFACHNYRNGYYNEDEDTYSWDDWDYSLTYNMVSNLFAPKNHSHYTSINTSNDIRTYLDNMTNFYTKDLRITSSINKHVYIVRVDATNYTINGQTTYAKYQEYYDIEEPDKIYKRKGYTDSGYANAKTTWGDWYVFEGVAE